MTDSVQRRVADAEWQTAPPELRALVQQCEEDASAVTWCQLQGGAVDLARDDLATSRAALLTWFRAAGIHAEGGRMFTLTMQTENAAFVGDAGREEIADILARVTRLVRGGFVEGQLTDSNGNVVGYWTWKGWDNG